MVSEMASLQRDSDVPAAPIPNPAAAVDEVVAAGLVGFAAQQVQRGWTGAPGMLQARSPVVLQDPAYFSALRCQQMLAEAEHCHPQHTAWSQSWVGVLQLNVEAAGYWQVALHSPVASLSNAEADCCQCRGACQQPVAQTLSFDSGHDQQHVARSQLVIAAMNPVADCCKHMV